VGSGSEFLPARPGAGAGHDPHGQGKATERMRYMVMTEISPEEVLERARGFFAEHSRLEAEAPANDRLRFTGDLGTADLRVDRATGHTNVHVETDRVAGLDITDLMKRFLYTLEHVV
ncbi:MAG: hypothetical protein ACE5FP_02130, partial [Gemmatimonadota bacterium]